MSLFKNIELIGLLAATLGTISLVPQVIKIWKSRSAHSVSLLMYVIICIDSVLWLVYALSLSLHPILIQSSITITCALIIIIMKLYWK